MSSRITIDPKRQLAARKATKKMLERFFIARTTYGDGPPRYRILMDGQYYEVDTGQLDFIKAGSTPADLDLDPVADD